MTNFVNFILKLLSSITSQLSSTQENSTLSLSMMPSEKCIALVKEFEGCRLTAYQDQKGIWTIGFGETGALIKPGLVWTQQQADDHLMTRLNAIGRIIIGCVRPSLTQAMFDALCSLVYNIGPGNFRQSTLIKCLNQRDFKGASDQFLAWDKITIAGIPQIDKGLIRRRMAEQALFNSV